LQIFVTHDVFLDKNVKTQQQQQQQQQENKKSNIKTLPERVIEPGTSLTKADALPPHHRVN